MINNGDQILSTGHVLQGLQEYLTEPHKETTTRSSEPLQAILRRWQLLKGERETRVLQVRR